MESSEKAKHINVRQMTDNFRRNYNEDIHGQWRANASEKVVYTEDFPAPMLCATEFSDNSLAKGKATKVTITFDITNPEAGIFTHMDNGVGIERVSDLSRFLKFGSTHSSDTYHQYAWGRFRAMTAFMPDYETATWSATFKLCKNPNTLSQISQPWSTPENMQRSIIEIPITEASREVGFEMVMKFNMSIFGNELARTYTTDPQKLFDKMKERLTTKYPETVFEKTEFILNVKKGDRIITQSSQTHKWKTFEQMLKNLALISPASCRIVFNEVLDWKSIKAHVTEYHLSRDNQELKKAFPTFGSRCIPAQRVFINAQERLIEPRSKPKMDKRDGHNNQNGEIVFIHAYSADTGSFADLPTPSTTKVSIKDDCPNLPGIYQMYLDRKKQVEDQKKAQQKQREREAKEKRKAEEAARAAELTAKAVEAASKAAATIKSSATTIKQTADHASSAGGGAIQNQKIIRSLIRKPKPSIPPQDSDDDVFIASSQSFQKRRIIDSDDSDNDDATPTSPSMPKLELIVTAAPPAPPAPLAPPAPPKSTFTIEDMKEMIQMSVALMTPENAATFKSQIAQQFGI
jgi:hypothetical protein